MDSQYEELANVFENEKRAELEKLREDIDAQIEDLEINDAQLGKYREEQRANFSAEEVFFY